MEKRARCRALSGTLFRYFGSGSIPTIDKRIATRRNRARVMELMAEHFRSLLTEGTGHTKPGAPITQGQLSIYERGFESEQPRHLLWTPVCILEPQPQYQSATTHTV